MNTISLFILGFPGSCPGGVSFGSINLSMVNATQRYGRGEAMKFSIVVAVGEVGQAGLAILFV